MLGVQLLLSVIVGLSVLALFVGVRTFVTPAESADRMQQLMGGMAGEAVSLRELEMRGSFYQRAVLPLITNWLKQLGRLAPNKNLEKLQQQLETAGFPGNLSVIDFLGLKTLFGILLAIFAVGIAHIARPDFSFLILAGVGLVFSFVGFMLPNVWLVGRIRKRKKEIVKSLPDALDMLTICVGAGVGLDGAMQRVTEAWNNALCEEFSRVLTEVKLGRTRTDALESMARRAGVDELLNFVTALVLADKLGVSISNTLRIQSQQMRTFRRQKAEEAAREASIKMLFPLVFLIFPAMFAVLLGPAVPLLLETLGGF